MQFRSVVSLEPDPDAIAADIADQLSDGPETLELVVAFVRPTEHGAAGAVMRQLRGALPARAFLACTAESVVAAGHEIEGRPATAVTVAVLPEVDIDALPPLGLDTGLRPTVVSNLVADDGPATNLDDVKAFVVLVDPFSVSTDAVVSRLHELAPGVPVIGGIASWGRAAGQNRLAQDDSISDAGYVGVALRGAIDVRAVVSQGCRPIGRAMTVTAAKGNLITELDGGSPIETLQAAYTEADDSTQAAMRSGVLLGRGVSRDTGDLGRGGYLIRGLLGADSTSGALAVHDRVEDGEIVQFHVRDAETAQEDLEMLLTSEAFRDPAAGALLFTCNGRGTRLFGRPDVDIGVIRSALGDDVPVTGFFCAGELGPIGERSFTHAYTASLAIFRPADPR